MSTLGPGPPTVLFVALPATVGGSSRSLVTVLRHLEGHCARVVACPEPSWLLDVVRSQGLAEEIVPLPGIDRPRWWRPIGAAQIMWWALRNRRQLAAVHANGLAELNLAACARVVVRRPVVAWVHDWKVSGWSRLLVRLIVRWPGATLAPVSSASAAMLRSAGLGRGSGEVIANPIDAADVVAPHRGAGPDLRVGYLGAPERYKGFHLLPAIAKQLAGAAITIGVFSGPESRLPEVWDELRAISDPPVEIRGLRTDVREVYGCCDVVLVPSLAESFGRVAAESMMNGLPVVASDLPALREVLGDAGLLVTAGDPCSFAAAIRRLVDDPSLRNTLGRAGRQRVEQYDPSHVVAALLRSYGVQSPPETRVATK